MSLLEELLHRPDWHADAACRGVDDPALFFPGRGEAVKTAQSICRHCPVRVDCLMFAMNNGERFGIWGGLTERQRRRLRRPANLRVVAS